MRTGWGLAGLLLLAACGADAPSAPPPSARPGLDGGSGRPRDWAPPVVTRPQAGAVTVRPTQLPAWEPGYHAALRWDTELPRITLRVRVPVARSGNALQLAFRTGDGSGRLYRATVAPAGTGGSLAGPAVPVTFDGGAGFSADARQRVVSDPLPFEVRAGGDLAVTIDVEGHFAASAIGLLPDSWADVDVPVDADAVAGWRETRAIGLQSVLVRGVRTRAVVAIGDSITEAFVTGDDDVRAAWPAIAGARLGLPVVNAAVSGQGLWEAREYLDEEVRVLPGVTDCVVLLGTNDLGAADEAWMKRMLGGLFADLEPFCDVWAGTLLPKDRPEIGDDVRALRRTINEWIRTEADVAGVIDFEAVLRDPDDADRWLPGMASDGVHPTAEGQRVIGEEAARFLGEVFAVQDAGR